ACQVNRLFAQRTAQTTQKADELVEFAFGLEGDFKALQDVVLNGLVLVEPEALHGRRSVRVRLIVLHQEVMDLAARTARAFRAGNVQFIRRDVEERDFSQRRQTLASGHQGSPVGEG